MPKRKDKSSIPTETLRAGFLKVLEERDGQPLKRIGRANAEVYQRSGGSTLRLRTNNQPVLMQPAPNGEVDVPLPWDAQDFVGVAYPEDDPRGGSKIICYLVPSAVASEAAHSIHQQWLAADTDHSRDNLTRVIHFDDDPRKFGRGYTHHWAQYLIGKISIDELPQLVETADPAQPAPVFSNDEDTLLEALAAEIQDREQERMRRSMHGVRLQIAKYGVIDAINRYLAHGVNRDVLDELIDTGAAHLTIESSILNPRYTTLLTDTSRQMAWDNLFEPRRLARSMLMHDLGPNSHN